MRFRRYIPEKLAWCVVLALLIASPSAAAAPDLTGEWSGMWHSHSGDAGPVSVSFEQNGSNVTGTMSLPGSDCFSSPSFTGTLDGNTLTGAFADANGHMNITGTVRGEALDGTYAFVAGPCAGDTGTFALVAVTPTPTPTPSVACVGDCDGSGDVTVSELVTMVNIALDSLPPEACLAGDADGNGSIEVNEIVAAVSNALNGCPRLGKTCAGIAALPCGAGEACDLRDSTCAIVDLGGVCVEKPGACLAVYLPVCGCNGITYSNDCQRLLAGAVLRHDGACSASDSGGP
jgi:hypothetical protein